MQIVIKIKAHSLFIFELLKRGEIVLSRFAFVVAAVIFIAITS